MQAYVGIRPQDTLARIWPDRSTCPTDAGVVHELSVITRNVNGVILPGSKTGEGKKRRVYVPEPVAEDFELWRPHSPDVFIFGRAVDGRPWTKTNYDNWRSRALRKRKDGSKFRQRCFKAAAEDLGLGSDLKPYDLRHTFATLAAHAGWTEDEIAFQLGNSTEVVSEIYRHLLDAAPRTRAAAAVDRQLHQAGSGTLPAPARELVKA